MNRGDFEDSDEECQEMAGRPRPKPIRKIRTPDSDTDATVKSEAGSDAMGQSTPGRGGIGEEARSGEGMGFWSNKEAGASSEPGGASAAGGREASQNEDSADSEQGVARAIDPSPHKPYLS